MKKIKETNLKNCGAVSNFSRDSSVYQSYEKIMVEKYGVKHALQNKNILKKQQETTIKRHGSLNMFNLEKVVLTMNKLYGVKYCMQNKKINRKSSENQKQTAHTLVCKYINGKHVIFYSYSNKTFYLLKFSLISYL